MVAAKLAVSFFGKIIYKFNKRPYTLSLDSAYQTGDIVLLNHKPNLFWVPGSGKHLTDPTGHVEIVYEMKQARSVNIT